MVWGNRMHSSSSVVPKECSAGSKRSATCSQVIRGYSSVIVIKV